MPWYAVALMLSGAALIGVLRIFVMIARALGYGPDNNPRPGYLPLRKKP